jgi:hypothetical protein
VEPRTVLLVGIPLILAAAVFLVMAVTAFRAGPSVGSLGRETGRPGRR